MALDDSKQETSGDYHVLRLLSKDEYPPCELEIPFVFKIEKDNDVTALFGCDKYSLSNNDTQLKIHLPYVYIKCTKQWYRVHGGGGNMNGVMASKHLSLILGLSYCSVSTQRGKFYNQSATKLLPQMYYEGNSSSVDKPRVVLKYYGKGAGVNDLEWLECGLDLNSNNKTKKTKIKIIDACNVIMWLGKQCDNDSQSILCNQIETFYKELQQLSSHSSKSTNMKNVTISHLKECQNQIIKCNKTCQNIIDKLKLCQIECSKINKNIENELNIDITKYKTWNIRQILNYIASIKDGKFLHYCKQGGDFEKALIDNKVEGKDLPDLDNGDLFRFGIKKFGDQKEIRDVLRQLK